MSSLRGRDAQCDISIPEESMRPDPQLRLAALLTPEALHTAQENVIIAALRRPSLASIIRGIGVSDRHFPVELRPAFDIAMTKSQEEIWRLVTHWPLYGKRIVE